MKKLVLINLSLAALLFFAFTEIHSQNKQQTIKKYNPLHRAILKGSKSLVKKYSKPRYFYFSDSNTPMPLEVAFRQNRMDMAKIMVRRGLNVDHKDYFGETAVRHMVCDVKWLKFVISSGANKNQVSSNLGGQSLLHIAARCPASESLKYLLQRKAYREAKDVSGGTPLFMAVDKKKVDNARMLIKAGARMEYVYKKEKRWALGPAIAHYDTAMVKLLLDSLHRVTPYTDEIYKKLTGQKFDNRELGSFTKGEMIKIYQMLRKKGLSPKPVLNYTCAAISSPLGRYWIDNEWKKRGWKLNAWRNSYGGSMLSCVTEKKDIRWLMGLAKFSDSPVALYASKNDFTEARYYVEKGYNVNGKDERGRNVLFFTGVKDCDIELVKYFIEKGANPNIKDISGETVYSSVNNLKKKDPVYTALLMKAGFKAGMKNSKGETAVDTASKVCRREFARPYNQDKLENCVDTLALLSGSSPEKFIPVKCRGRLRLSRHEEYKYITKKDGYYKWQGGKLVKVKLPDPCGKYRREVSSGKISEPSKKPGVFGKWVFIGRSASSGQMNRNKMGFGRPFKFYHDRYTGKNWELKIETTGVFKQILIMGAASGRTKDEDMKIIYRGTIKTLNSKELMKRGKKYPLWLIKMNGASRGFMPVRGFAKVYIRTD